MSDIDLSEKAQGRIIWQYRNGQKFKAWVDVLPAVASARIQDAANDVAGLINIDTARGEQLNICGRIVGIGERPSINSDDLEVFAYNGVAGAQPYGVAPYKGRGIDPVSLPIPDYLYRLVIRAKIIKNTRAATVDDVKEGVEYILGGDFEATIVDLQDMSMRVILSEEVPFNVRALIEIFDLVPRPQGVKLEIISSTPNQDESGPLGGDMLGAVMLGGDNTGT